MRLHLIQHGEAVSKQEDPERPLSAQGRHDVEKLAAFLAQQKLGVERSYHSGKTRARQTAELLQGAVAPNRKPEARDGLGPNDPVEPLAEELAGWDEDTVITGHLPFVSRLVSRLVVGREDVGIAAFTPGTVVCLERGENGEWSIDWMVRPELLVVEK